MNLTAVGLLCLALAVGMVASRAYAELPPGLVEGKLAPCPSSPNCVCSEYPHNESHFSEPVSMQLDGNSAARLQQVVEEIGGRLVRQEEDYLAFTFTSRVFRFVDDFELRLDRDNNLVHFRSASRVGYSDLGVNRRRVEHFKAALDAQ